MEKEAKQSEELKYEEERAPDQLTLVLASINSKIDFLVDAQRMLEERLDRVMGAQ